MSGFINEGIATSGRTFIAWPEWNEHYDAEQLTLLRYICGYILTKATNSYRLNN